MLTTLFGVLIGFIAGFTLRGAVGPWPHPEPKTKPKKFESVFDFDYNIESSPKKE